MLLDSIHGNRRLDTRYEFELAVRFFYKDESGVHYVGSGITAELSRGGIRFFTEAPPPNGREVEMRIAWPIRLQNGCPIELVVVGAVLRSSARGTVVTMRSYEFRSWGERSFCETAPYLEGGRVA